MKADDFDKRFDEGRDITEHLHTARARRPGHEAKRVNVDFPDWMVRRLDREAKRLGVARQSVIKMVIADHLEKPGA